jgi:integrase
MGRAVNGAGVGYGPRINRQQSVRARRAGGNRVDKIWTADDEAVFLRLAPAHLHLPLLLALWTGQRQGDLLRLPWSAYDGSRIRLRQSKTGARVSFKAGAPLKAALDRTAKRSTMILVNSDGKPWTSDGFRASWRKAQTAAGIAGVTFNDLRGTAVTRLMRPIGLGRRRLAEDQEPEGTGGYKGGRRNFLIFAVLCSRSF